MSLLPTKDSIIYWHINFGYRLFIGLLYCCWYGIFRITLFVQGCVYHLFEIRNGHLITHLQTLIQTGIQMCFSGCHVYHLVLKRGESIMPLTCEEEDSYSRAAFDFAPRAVS